MVTFCGIFKIDIYYTRHACSAYHSFMDLISLRFFVETARQRSISKAAVSLGVVQPALSRRIQLLEDSLGVRLLMRHRRGVEPTEAGHILLARGELLLRTFQQVEAELRSEGAEPLGPVGLGFPPSIANLFMGRLLSQSLARYPKIELYLQEDYALAVRDALLAGKIDLGIMSFEAQHPELASQALFEESMWLVGTPGNWTFGDSGVSLRASILNDLPLIVGSFMHTLLKKHEIRGKFRLRVLTEANSLTLCREALRAGAGFLVVPPSSFDRELRSGEFIGAPLQGLVLTRGLFYHRDRPLGRAVLAIKAMIEEEVRQLCQSRSEIIRPLKRVDASLAGRIRKSSSGAR